jgi:hypothetical protein
MTIEVMALLQRSPTSNSNWIGEYNRLVLEYLYGQRDLSVTTTYFDDFQQDPGKLLGILDANPQLRLLLGNSQCYLLPRILASGWKGKIFAHVHTLPGNMFEPYMFKYPDFEVIDTYLNRMAAAFFNSRFQMLGAVSRKLIDASTARVTGFPIDGAMLTKYRGAPGERDDRLVVFNQRLSLEKNPTLICLVTEELVRRGYRVEVLQGDLIDFDGALTSYLNTLRRAGAEVRVVDKETYWRTLGRAKVVIHCSAFDSFSVAAAEALILGAELVAPRSMCYPELFPRARLYEPYAIQQIVQMVVDASKAGADADHTTRAWDKHAVFARYHDELTRR